MTDLEKIHACAIAMELPNVKVSKWGVTYQFYFDTVPRIYDPLRNDEQAMALKKVFKLSDSCHHNDIDGTDWIVTHRHAESMSFSLNSAIVDCVDRKSVV